MTFKKLTLCLLSLFFAASPLALADQVFLNNGDRLTGTVLTEGTGNVSIEIQGIGNVTIDRSVIKEIVSAQELAKREAQEAALKEAESNWSGEVSAGFDRRRGNTNTTELFAEAKIQRETDITKFVTKGRLFYSEEDRKMNAQKYRWSSRYDHRFGESKKWYGYGNFESDRDRFANIDLRYTAGSGIGYHLFEEERYKLQLESALAYTRTKFRDDTDTTNEMVLVPRAYGELMLIGESKVTQEFTIYPSLTESGEYRWISETIFHAPLNESVALKFHFIDEYNSMPGGGAKKNDLRIISTIGYSF